MYCTVIVFEFMHFSGVTSFADVFR